MRECEGIASERAKHKRKSAKQERERAKHETETELSMRQKAKHERELSMRGS